MSNTYIVIHNGKNEAFLTIKHTSSLVSFIERLSPLTMDKLMSRSTISMRPGWTYVGLP